MTINMIINMSIILTFDCYLNLLQVLKNNFKVFKTGFDLVLYSTNFSIYTISHDPQCIYSPTGWTMWSEVLQYFLWSNPFWWPITKCVQVYNLRWIMLNEIRFQYLKTSQKGLKVEKAEQIAGMHNG